MSDQKDFEYNNNGKMHILEAGSVIVTPLYVIQYDETMHENLNKTFLEQWENPTVAIKEAFMAFLVESQNCQGQALAYAEIEGTVNMLLLKYEIGIHMAGDVGNKVML